MLVSAESLDDLVRQAEAAPRRRQHRNLHSDFDEPCQRLLNAICEDSYIPPHRHGLESHAETLFAVRGLFALVLFNDEGSVRQFTPLGTEAFAGLACLCAGADLPAGTWHTVLAMTPGAVLLEAKAGPFDPLAAKARAPWAPAEGAAEAGDYVSELRREAKRIMRLEGASPTTTGKTAAGPLSGLR